MGTEWSKVPIGEMTKSESDTFELLNNYDKSNNYLFVCERLLKSFEHNTIVSSDLFGVQRELVVVKGQEEIGNRVYVQADVERSYRHPKKNIVEVGGKTYQSVQYIGSGEAIEIDSMDAFCDFAAGYGKEFPITYNSFSRLTSNWFEFCANEKRRFRKCVGGGGLYPDKEEVAKVLSHQFKEKVDHIDVGENSITVVTKPLSVRLDSKNEKYVLNIGRFAIKTVSKGGVFHDMSVMMQREGGELHNGVISAYVTCDHLGMSKSICFGTGANVVGNAIRMDDHYTVLMMALHIVNQPKWEGGTPHAEWHVMAMAKDPSLHYCNDCASFECKCVLCDCSYPPHRTRRLCESCEMCSSSCSCQVCDICKKKRGIVTHANIISKSEVYSSMTFVLSICKDHDADSVISRMNGALSKTNEDRNRLFDMMIQKENMDWFRSSSASATVTGVIRHVDANVPGDVSEYLDRIQRGEIVSSPARDSNDWSDEEDSNLAVCAHCGGEDDEDEMHYIENVGQVCRTCAGEYYESCSHCGEWVDRDVAIFSRGEYYCNRHAPEEEEEVESND